MKYRLYHRKSKCWVTDIKYDYGSYDDLDDAYIAWLELVGQDNKESALVIDESEQFLLSPESVHEQHGLERIYMSDEAYKYYSEELDGWLISISDVTMFEYANKNNVYPMFNLRKKDESFALVVREEETIKWLDKNTKLQKVKVSK